MPDPTPPSAPRQPNDPKAIASLHAKAYLILYSQEWEKDNTLNKAKFDAMLHSKHAANVAEAKKRWLAQAKEKK